MLSTHEYLNEEDKMYLLPEGVKSAKPVLWGHKLMDRAIPGGVSPYSPGFYLIQGPSGARKTTFVLNMVINMHFSEHLPENFTTYWWSVESLMSQEHVMSMIRAIIATKIVVYNAHDPGVSWEWLLGPFCPGKMENKEPTYDEYMEVCRGIKTRAGRLISNNDMIPTCSMGMPDPQKTLWSIKRDVSLTAQFIKSSHRFPGEYVMTNDMYYGYMAAEYCMYAMNIISMGTSEHRDKKIRKLRAFETNNMSLSGAKWLDLAKRSDGNCQFVIDHVTAFEMGGSSEYEKQRAFKPYLKKVIDEYPLLFWVVIQDGVGNQRDYERYGYVMGSQGGDVLKQECNANWRKRRYDREKHLYWDVLDRPEKTRIGDHPAAAFMLAPHSGAYIGEAQLASKVIP